MKYYIDKKQIERLASNIDVYRRGTVYFNESRVKEIENQENNETNTVWAKVDGSYNNYKVSLRFDNSGFLQNYTCSCEAFGLWKGCCKHVVATLLKLYDISRESAVLSKKLRASKKLLNIFENLTYAELDSSISRNTDITSLVDFIPTLCSDIWGEVYLTFKIGRRKKYVIKELSEFVTLMDKGENFRYGKELEFQHKIGNFSTQSAKLVRFLLEESKNYVRMGKILNSFRLFNDSALSGRKLPLSNTALDQFFELFEGQSIEASFLELDFSDVTFTTDSPNISFKLSKDEHGLKLSCENENLQLFTGEKFRYILLQDKFYKVDIGLYDVISPIINMLKNLQEPSITFSTSEINKLAIFLIPKLKAYDLLEDESDLDTNFLIIENTKKVYLDSQNGYVTCNAFVCYGGEEIELKSGSEIHEFTNGRNVFEEYKFKASLSQHGFVFSGELDKFVLSGDELIYDFYYSPSGLNELKTIAQVYATDEFSRTSSKTKRNTSVGLRIYGGLLEVDINTNGYSNNELIDIMNSFKLKKRFHRLKNGGFINFSEESEQFKTLDQLFMGLSATDKDIKSGMIKVPQYRALYTSEIVSLNKNLSTNIDSSFQKLRDDFKNFKTVDFKIPETLDLVLRAYQKDGFRWLKTLSYYGFGGILADDMGLGKTLEIIAVLLSEKSLSEKPSIVIAPTSLIYNWEKEIIHFAPALNSCVVAGIAQKRKEIFENSIGIDVYITTYDMLKRDIEFYKKTSFNYIIADEAQSIKNPHTQTAKALKLLQGNIRFALTGTPIENALTELWSIFDFIMPHYLYTASKFNKIYSQPIIKNDDKEIAKNLRHQIAPFVLRRLKSDVLKELPSKIETTLYAEMYPEQKKLYTAFLLKAKGELDETIKEGKYKDSKIEILSKLTRLRQICCHPCVFVENYRGGSGKLDLTVQTVKDSLEAGHRILIFSQFTKMLSIICDIFDKSGIKYFYLDGATPSKQRTDMAENFNNGEMDVFLISLKAGGTGLNLTGADIVIHYDPWWNPAVMDQASDRAHRFGQQKTVQVINIVAKDSVEEKIMLLQEKKKNLVDSVLDEGATFINTMSENEIVQLFQ